MLYHSPHLLFLLRSCCTNAFLVLDTAGSEDCVGSDGGSADADGDDDDDPNDRVLLRFVARTLAVSCSAAGALLLLLRLLLVQRV